MKLDVKYELETFPASKNFQVFKVLGGCIYQIISPKAYYLDGSGFDYFYMEFTDPVTADIICKHLQEAEEYENNIRKRKNR
jgi:hypothetical protein